MTSPPPQTPDDGPFSLLVRGACAVLTGDGPEGVDAGLTLGALPDAVVGVRGKTVAYIGPESELPPTAIARGTEVLDAKGGLVTPGFVDSHSHAVYAGDRSEEFALRALDVDAAAITRAGGEFSPPSWPRGRRTRTAWSALRCRGSPGSSPKG